MEHLKQKVDSKNEGLVRIIPFKKLLNNREWDTFLVEESEECIKKHEEKRNTEDQKKKNEEEEEQKKIQEVQKRNEELENQKMKIEEPKKIKSAIIGIFFFKK